jgi:hypothetical protein
MTLTRRGLLASGAAAVVGAAAAALYGRLLVGDRFEGLVAAHLGVDRATGDALLRALRQRLGADEYDLRAAGFAIAVRDPVAAGIPRSLRRDAIEAFVGPLLMYPAAVNAYAAGRGDPAGRACAGLVRPA